VIMAMIYAVGHVSGAHFNPAVSFAFAVTRHFPWRRVVGYWLAQAAGALAAAALVRASLGDNAHLGATLPLCLHAQRRPLPDGAGVLREIRTERPPCRVGGSEAGGSGLAGGRRGDARGRHRPVGAEAAEDRPRDAAARRLGDHPELRRPSPRPCRARTGTCRPSGRSSSRSRCGRRATASAPRPASFSSRSGR
jgi:hypothetical protein